mmetsp:Transcript_4921/g.12745  ORF Transcript_4921/g.12745 Transcript_4921/m.12745 type:complete len:233 (-) Transcript_4921:57-755(-)|eukprot:CAMPEP_0182928090 /NCGR_PEP_ID=MMETSP0105_2-20130417/15171_1 /TAXON_ID=81532 ORGANISM="Acanthoeca-like sp., Strain 10tr" /NCGR_SAMPLE_ID=MMETSP0105_2 /ASSEMBLY_ACC=CAM_ASM_000205 /LENGTH=232 /DNA_ID=CAMNT_0025066079 /DNA_START=45 /DNA_END=743 /DNA_ORIENTATION=-
MAAAAADGLAMEMDGWCEWRVFFQAQASAPAVGGAAIPTDILPSLRGPPEVRADAYYPHSPSVGIKARNVRGDGAGGSSKVEVKTRTTALPGGFEGWHKTTTSRARVAKILATAGHGAADAWADVPPILVEKQRQATALPGGALAEFTKVTIAPDAKGVPPEDWVTVAVEGHLHAVRLAVEGGVLERCQAAAGGEGSLHQMGYPEFVIRRSAAWQLLRHPEVGAAVAATRTI